MNRNVLWKLEWKRNNLHYACHQSCSLRRIRRIVCACPDSVKQLDCELNTPLHVAVSMGSSKKIIEYLILKYPGAASIQNSQGKNPLHVFCEMALRKHHNPRSIVEMIVGVCPDSLKQRDNFSRTPLQFAICEASIDVIDYLLTEYPKAALMKDNDGRTPFHNMFYQRNTFLDSVLIYCSSSSSNYLDSFSMVHISLSFATAAPIVLIMNDNSGKIPLDYAISFGADEKVVNALTENTKKVWQRIRDAYFERKKSRADAFMKGLCYDRLPCDNTLCSDFDGSDDEADYCGEHIT